MTRTRHNSKTILICALARIKGAYPFRERQVSPEELCGPRTTGKTRTMTDDGFQMAGWQACSRTVQRTKIHSESITGVHNGSAQLGRQEESLNKRLRKRDAKIFVTPQGIDGHVRWRRAHVRFQTKTTMVNLGSEEKWSVLRGYCGVGRGGEAWRKL
jgi:hypothetical protein